MCAPDHLRRWHDDCDVPGPEPDFHVSPGGTTPFLRRSGRKRSEFPSPWVVRGRCPELTAEASRITVRPQVFVNLSADRAVFHRMDPTAHDRTAVECSWFSLPHVCLPQVRESPRTDGHHPAPCSWVPATAPGAGPSSPAYGDQGGVLGRMPSSSRPSKPLSGPQPQTGPQKLLLPFGGRPTPFCGFRMLCCGCGKRELSTPPHHGFHREQPYSSCAPPVS
ncbi:SRPBCC family protein [Streptomyces smyrnaeus]|uniref:SRPBCC family protein n=1 Tax=Streptomyces smyrnaeus TaxID=1387713 RepID=UPI003556D4FC